MDDEPLFRVPGVDDPGPARALPTGLPPMAANHRGGYIHAVTINPPKIMKSSIRNQAAGSAKIAAGKVKSGTGRVVGNQRLQASGQADQAEGRVQKKVGQIQRDVDC